MTEQNGTTEKDQPTPLLNGTKAEGAERHHKTEAKVFTGKVDVAYIVIIFHVYWVRASEWGNHLNLKYLWLPKKEKRNGLVDGWWPEALLLNARSNCQIRIWRWFIPINYVNYLYYLGNPWIEIYLAPVVIRRGEKVSNFVAVTVSQFITTSKTGTLRSTD